MQGVGCVAKLMHAHVLSGMQPFTRVTCEAKVLKVDEVKSGLGSGRMQNAIISDGQTVARITV